MQPLPRTVNRAANRAAAWAVQALSVVLAAAAIFIASIYPPEPVTQVAMVTLILAIPYPLLGAIIISRTPRTRLGWIFSLVGLFQAINIFTDSYGHYALETSPVPLPLSDIAIWASQWSWMVSLGLASTFLFLLFPDGRVPSPRWRWLAWLAAFSVAFTILITALGFWPDRGLPTLCQQFNEEPNKAALSRLCPPNQVNHANDTLDTLMLGGFLLTGTAALASVVSLFVRFRRSVGIERQQIKWFVFSAALVFVALVVQFTPLNASIISQIFALTILSLPIAVGAAILRYHLWDIDVIIRRTLVYSALIAILALVYLGSVLMLQAIFRAITGENSTLAIVLSTLIIAALFNQLRMRIRDIIDRRFYRRRYNAELAVQNFGAYLRSEVDVERLNDHLLWVIQETVQPSISALWLRRKE